jgi:hypothetical protein
MNVPKQILIDSVEIEIETVLQAFGPRTGQNICSGLDPVVERI